MFLFQNLEAMIAALQDQVSSLKHHNTVLTQLLQLHKDLNPNLIPPPPQTTSPRLSSHSSSIPPPPPSPSLSAPTDYTVQDYSVQEVVTEKLQRVRSYSPVNKSSSPAAAAATAPLPVRDGDTDDDIYGLAVIQRKLAQLQKEHHLTVNQPHRDLEDDTTIRVINSPEKQATSSHSHSVRFSEPVQTRPRTGSAGQFTALVPDEDDSHIEYGYSSGGKLSWE